MEIPYECIMCENPLASKECTIKYSLIPGTKELIICYSCFDKFSPEKIIEKAISKYKK